MLGLLIIVHDLIHIGTNAPMQDELMICGVAQCGNPDPGASSPQQDQYPALRHVAMPRSSPRRPPRPLAVRTSGDATRDLRDPFLADALPQPRFDPRSYRIEATAEPRLCQSRHDQS